jgi:hypothetical protein
MNNPMQVKDNHQKQEPQPKTKSSPAGAACSDDFAPERSLGIVDIDFSTTMPALTGFLSQR